MNVIGEIRQRMEDQGLILGEAHAFVHSSPAAAPGRLDWDVVVEKFLASREGLRATTLRDLRTRTVRTLQVLQAEPRPRDGRALMRA